MSYTYHYAPESDSRRPDVVSLPQDLFERRVLLDQSVNNVFATIAYEQIDDESAITAATKLATKQTFEPVVDPTVAAVNAMSDQQIAREAAELLGTVDFTREELIAAKRDQVNAVWAGQEPADRIHLSSQPPHMDPTFFAQMEG